MRKFIRVKEEWQEKSDSRERSAGKRMYGKRKDVQIPISLAEELEKAADAKGISGNRLIVEAIAQYLNFDLTHGES